MKKLKVMSVVGTRPEIIRLSRVLAKLDEYCDHLIIHTGQNYDYELNEVFSKIWVFANQIIFLMPQVKMQQRLLDKLSLKLMMSLNRKNQKLC